MRTFWRYHKNPGYFHHRYATHLYSLLLVGQPRPFPNDCLGKLLKRNHYANRTHPPRPLLLPGGKLAHTGWSRHPLLDCNLEEPFLRRRALQRFRIKRWDYYAVFSPRRFFSATIADLGYAGNLFVYTLDFETGDLHEEGVVIPLGKGIELARNSTTGDSSFDDGKVKIAFRLQPGKRCLSVSWPAFHAGRGIWAEIDLVELPEYESMNITIPIGAQRFYFNRKINCMPASGFIQYGDMKEALAPGHCLGSLDWGRGVWEYRSSGTGPAPQASSQMDAA